VCVSRYSCRDSPRQKTESCVDRAYVPIALLRKRKFALSTSRNPVIAQMGNVGHLLEGCLETGFTGRFAKTLQLKGTLWACLNMFFGSTSALIFISLARLSPQ
jgi:hypothetical protein